MSLSTFFNPRSVAVVGVSADESKLGAVVFKNLIEAGFSGNLYGVNPKLAGQELKGKKCFASVRDIPEPVDLVVLLVPARFARPPLTTPLQTERKTSALLRPVLAKRATKNWN